MGRAPYSGVPDVQQQGPVGAFEHPQASPQDFGAGVGQAEQGLAQSGEKFGQVLADNAVKMQEQINDRDANQAINKYMQGAGDEWAKFGAMEGQQAADYRPTFNKNLFDMRDQVGASLPTNAARLAYDNYSRFMTTRWVNQGAEHAAKGLHESYKLTNAQSFESAITAGILQQNDMPSVALQAARATDLARQGAVLNGATPEQAEYTAVKGRGAYYGRLIKDYLDQGKTGLATQVFQSVRPNLDGDSILAIDGMLKPVIRKQAMDGWVNGAMGTTAAGFAGVGKGAFTPASLPPGISLTEDAMVRTVAGEAGAEPLDGQRAVAAVIMNRANSSGASPRDVVFAPNQFEPWNGGAARQRLESMDPASPQYQKILNDVVRPIVSGQAQDPTGGATHFYAPKAQADLGRNAPSWASGTPTVIGNHNFYKVGYGPGSAPPAGVGTAGVINPGQKSPAEMAFPDEEAIVQKALRDWDDPGELNQVLSAVRSRFATLNAAVKTDRDALSNAIPQMESQALDGVDIQLPDTLVQHIQHVFPPEKAAEHIENLTIAKAVAPQFAAVKYGTPGDIAAAEARLSNNLGLGGASPETSDLPDLAGSNEAYRLRQNILRKFKTAITARDSALNGEHADPATYAAGSPLMRQAFTELTAPMPQGLPQDQQQALSTKRAEDYAQKAVSFQQGLGVRVPHVLTRAAAQDMATEFNTADPTTTDVGKMIADKGRAYGQAWPKIFGDMVTMGKLSPEYQTLAQIEGKPERADFQQMLKYVAASPKNRAGLHEAAGTTTMAQIERDIIADPTLHQFEQTAQIPGVRANIDQIQQVHEAVKDLAAFYSLPGGASSAAPQRNWLGFQTRTSAVARAVDAIVGGKYAFDTSDNYLRVPTKDASLRQVQDYGDVLKGNLKQEDIQGLTAAITPQSLGIVNQQGTQHLDEADKDLHLTPQERFLYQQHLTNLNGPGKVRQPGGEVSTLLQTSVEHNGQFYNVPTVWDGKEHSEDEAEQHAAQVGWDKWPGYTTRDAAEARYQTLHGYLERDTKDYLDREGQMARIQKDIVAPIQQAAGHTLEGIQRTGKWVTNESDGGAYLVAQDQNGILKPVRKADGGRLEFSWKDAKGGPPALTRADVPPVVQ